MTESGFPDPKTSVERLHRLRETAGSFEQQRAADKSHSVPPWFKTLKRILRETPSPEVVLMATDQFVRKCPRTNEAFALFEETPRSLEVLGRLACSSPYLTQVLMGQPKALWELTTERRTAEMKSREGFLKEAILAIEDSSGLEAKLSALRQYRHRQVLRIGMCDAFGLLDLKFVTLQISLLADAMVQVCLDLACNVTGIADAPFAVIALGKHGGEELNYSSDIDLILITDDDRPSTQRVARHLIDALSSQMATGFLYRVDMRLRPWGDAGPLVSTPDTYEEYLRNDAALWEKQALLKARVIAGNFGPGEELLKRLPDLLFAAADQQAIVNSIRQMKGQIETQLRKVGKLHSEVKLGAGSIRDVEFLVQALQLIHGKKEPRIASPNTLDALVRLAEFGFIDATTYRQLREGYIFLRTIEHALQLLHNQQTHELPRSIEHREWLARRLDYPSAKELLIRFEEHRLAVRGIFDLQFGTTTTVSSASKSTEPVVTSTVRECSPLTSFVMENADFLEHFRTTAWRDLSSDAMCVVHSQRLSDASSLRLITIAAVEVKGLTSMLCGLFFANRLDIREGETINGGGQSRFGYTVPSARFLGVFLCEDTTEGTTSQAAVTGAELRERLTDLMRLNRKDPALVHERLVEMFCKRVSHLKPQLPSMKAISVDVDNTKLDSATVLSISADDSFGFFFEVANALTISGFRILRAELGQADGRIDDRLYVTEAAGGRVTSALRVEELRTAMTLIKKFTSWLPSYNDPHHALFRFRDLLKKLLTKSPGGSRFEELRDPDVLRNVGQVLGMSRYLWEDFLQVRTVDLLPLLTQRGELSRRISPEELQAELLESLESAGDSERNAQQLNAFKDHHLFRIDLRHVLGHCRPFGAFSQEITELAEIVVSTACRLAVESLSRDHGLPRLANGDICPFTIAALGKFGGIEMGFASDIEMFAVFQQDCRTDGPHELSAGSFYERMFAVATKLIRSRHQGIFEIDLRMRPYGQAGSPAISLETFETYFAAEGDAWPYERQSLVKMRCVAGHEEFGSRVLSSCHDLIYQTSGFDFDAMRAMREKQVRQLVRGGTINAKLSSGALVDLEYAVQALQLTFGGRLSSLRLSNTMKTLRAAHQEGLLTNAEYESATEAYMFFREMIDCLRMARGNAHDLTVPAENSPEMKQLTKRMEAVHDSSLPLSDLESQLKAIREFSKRAEEICLADSEKAS